MAFQCLLYEVRKLNPVMDESGEDFSLGLDCISQAYETPKTYDADNYRKPFIAYNQGLNTSMPVHAMHVGAA